MEPAWRSLDLSLLDAAAREQRLAEILAADRAERFDVSTPPLLRFALIRLSADEHRLVLSHHHLLMDGWSMPILVQELLTLYGHPGDSGALARVRPYRDYLAWLAGQDQAVAVAAWREALAGLEEPTRVVPPDPARIPLAPEQWTLSLSVQLSAALTALARRQGVTLNTVIEAVWAILLGRLTGRDDVVFGVTVAGRPPELAGIETMVGLFINTLPLRVRLAPAAPLALLLRQVQGASRGCWGTSISGLPRSRAWPAWASCSTRLWCSRTIRLTASILRRISAACACSARKGETRPIIR